jgi:hypothetical protein
MTFRLLAVAAGDAILVASSGTRGNGSCLGLGE